MTKFAVLIANNTAYVKEWDFYVQQGGPNDIWGRRWIPIEAKDIESARRKALRIKLTYIEPLPSYGDLITVKEFRACCKDGGFIDYDGSGHPVKNGKMMCQVDIKPSKLNKIPKDATHIMWFNR